jgi:hypothetical protein
VATNGVLFVADLNEVDESHLHFHELGQESKADGLTFGGLELLKTFERSKYAFVIEVNVVGVHIDCSSGSGGGCAFGYREFIVIKCGHDVIPSLKLSLS